MYIKCLDRAKRDLSRSWTKWSLFIFVQAPWEARQCWLTNERKWFIGKLHYEIEAIYLFLPSQREEIPRHMLGVWMCEVVLLNMNRQNSHKLFGGSCWNLTGCWTDCECLVLSVNRLNQCFTDFMSFPHLISSPHFQSHNSCHGPGSEV